ncbi:hypothetical protein HNQ60_005009 [Povalibacter uvarum]|uniref:PepSY domain-containing protein n=1 Tax=Povalibacter uvarum TaxID=732238 RepID=A0A841HW26_9GAMM|nr:hypothetical protein [Povalibacter uvarum]MBB6096118.1 hypothetical protein [Povalibacter uvarum]
MSSKVILVSCVLAGSLMTAACSKEPAPASEPAAAPAQKVDATGKETVDLSSVPPEVLAAVEAARPGMQVAEAEHEQRNGNDYYDVEGTFNGAEIELDLTKVDGVWKVVEIQRDIVAADAPAKVMAALTGANAQFAPTRIIESDQGNGVVIYEFFGPDAAGKETKIEVKLENDAAEVLQAEWKH